VANAYTHSMRLVVRLLSGFWLFISGLFLVMLQVPPSAGMSNLAAWLHWAGVAHVPPWLASHRANAIGTIIALLALAGWITRWAIMKWVLGPYRVTFNEGAPKQEPPPKRRSGPNLRWRTSRRPETVGIRMGDRSEAHSNDVRGFDVGVDLGADSSASGNRAEGPGPNQGNGASQRTMLRIGGPAKYVGMELCQTRGGSLIHGPKVTDSTVRASSATAPGWDKGKGGK
jgi:hypothetical protein